jgi:hypothetical protein
LEDLHNKLSFPSGRKAFVLDALIWYLNAISHPQWPLYKSNENAALLQSQSKDFPGFAAWLLKGLLTGYVYMLNYGTDWEEIADSILLPASDFKELINYQHFLQVISHRFPAKTTSYTGITTSIGHGSEWRIIQHYDPTWRSSRPSRYYEIWDRQGSVDQGFFAIASYPKGTPSAVYEVIEGFNIASSGLWETRLFFDVTKELPCRMFNSVFREPSASLG